MRVMKVSIGSAEDEVTVLKALSHPNVIQMYESFTMAVEGTTLNVIVMDCWLALLLCQHQPLLLQQKADAFEGVNCTVLFVMGLSGIC